MAPHSSTLAWKIPWTEEPGGLQSMGSLRVGHDWATSLSLFTFMHWRRKWQSTPVFLPGESQGWGSWWAAIYGVTQSRTRLKQLSSSSLLWKTKVLAIFHITYYSISEKAMAPHSSTFAWKIPWTEEPGRLQSMGLLESDTTEQLHFHFSLSCIGEGNGKPLQCSCLENPRDGGAWWAAIYGIAQSWTRLKWLSSSSTLQYSNNPHTAIIWS